MNEEILERWLRRVRSRSAHTARSYAGAVRHFLSVVGKRLEELTPDDAEYYLNNLADSDLAKASQAHHVSAARSFLRYCQQKGILEESVLDALERPEVSVTSRNRYLDRDEARRLIEAARKMSTRAYLAISAMTLTGVRVAELAHAKWRDLYRDPNGNVGLVVKGKGDREREVLIRDDLWAVIREHRREQGLNDSLSASDRTPLLMDRHRTAYSTVGIWKLVKAATRKAGIDKPVSPHWLRHTYGTLAALDGAVVYQIRQDMGHRHITTSERYIHWAKGLENSAAKLIQLPLLDSFGGRA